MLADVMDILINISSRLDALEKGMEELKAAREEAHVRAQCMSATQQLPCTSRGCCRQRAEPDPAPPLSTLPCLAVVSESVHE